MNPSDIYSKLEQELEDGELSEIQKKVFNLLKDKPAGLSRQELIMEVYGYWPESLDGNTDDRKIRKAIERLRQRLFPIVSTSGRPGYRLDVSREAVEKMIIELKSRRRHIDNQIESALKFYEIPESYVVDPSQMKQMELTS